MKSLTVNSLLKVIKELTLEQQEEFFKLYKPKYTLIFMHFWSDTEVINRRFTLQRKFL